MKDWVPKGHSDKNGDHIDDHPHSHDLVIWDDTTWAWVCTRCGMVLQGAPPHHPFLPNEVFGKYPSELQNTQDRREIDVLNRGSIIGMQDLANLPPTMKELFQRLYTVNRNTIAAFQHDKSKSQFDTFYRRLLKMPKFREAFPPPKREELVVLFTKVLENLYEQSGRKLQQETKIKIFLVLIESQLEPEGFQEILQRFEIANETLYETKKQVFKFIRDYKAVNAQKKEDFIDKAKVLVSEAVLDPVVRGAALDILSKRAQFGGLVIRKSPNVLAAAAIYVAGQKKISRNKARKAVNASYLPPDAIADCKKVLQVKQEDFVRTQSQKTLLIALKKRDRLLQTRQALLSELSAEAERAFPGIKQILTLRNVSTRRFLKQYSSTHAIVTLTQDEIAQFLHNQSRGHLRHANRLANQLLTAAQKLEVVGRRPRPGNLLQIQTLIAELERVELERGKLEQQMRAALGEEGNRLMQAKGVGLVTASIILVSRSSKTASHILTHKSFFERSLKLAFQSFKRNRTIQQRYPTWVEEQAKPPLEILQQMTETLIQAVPSQLPL